jgi:hypothetical protein
MILLQSSSRGNQFQVEITKILLRRKEGLHPMSRLWDLGGNLKKEFYFYRCN